MNAAKVIVENVEEVEQPPLPQSWESVSTISESRNSRASRAFDNSTFGVRQSLPQVKRRESLLSIDLSSIPEETSELGSLDTEMEVRFHNMHPPTAERSAESGRTFNVG